MKLFSLQSYILKDEQYFAVKKIKLFSLQSYILEHEQYFAVEKIKSILFSLQQNIAHLLRYKTVD
jgi:hypothetical protein